VLLAYAAEHGVTLPPVEARDRWHRTALHWAVLNGHWGALRFLVTRMGAPVRTPLIKALTHRRRTHLAQESARQICRRLYGDNSRPARLLRALEGGPCHDSDTDIISLPVPLPLATGPQSPATPEPDIGEGAAATAAAADADAAAEDATMPSVPRMETWLLAGLLFAGVWIVGTRIRSRSV
jgi:hypothetical protein